MKRKQTDSSMISGRPTVRSGPSLWDQAGPTRTRPIARNTDPETSVKAATGTGFMRSDQTVGKAILKIMQGVPDALWTDEQLHDALVESGKTWSDSRARHGRLHLQDVGLIEPMKTKGKTKDGGRCRVWGLTESARAEAGRLNQTKEYIAAAKGSAP